MDGSAPSNVPTPSDDGDDDGDDGGCGGGGVAGWIRAYFARGAAAAEKVKALGLAGVTAYGIFNTLYYTLAFTTAWTLRTLPPETTVATAFKIAAETISLVWAGSQVTKLARAGLALASAPRCDALMRWMVAKTGMRYEATFTVITLGCFLGSAGLFALLIVAKATAGL